jgi:phosphate:Na+ symporter
MDMVKIIMLVTGGLVLFMYAVTMLGQTIKNLAGKKPNNGCKIYNQYFQCRYYRHITYHPARFIIGCNYRCHCTCKFRYIKPQAMGIVLGANVGTTFSSQIIAMDIAKYSPVFLFLRLFLMFVSKHKKNQ